MTKADEYLLIGGGLIAAAVALWIASNPSGAGRAVGAAAVDAVNGVVTGTVESVGELVGVPVTSPDKCAAAKAAGDTWEASFACPASEFLSWLWNR
ncbi:MAG: hypothetical protein EG825_10260 [Rhodocyclaceae bacterium]|nr:hypothetical protein [Rhodocyclaceae bacterium]